MELSGNGVVITGDTTGIGLAQAKRLHATDRAAVSAWRSFTLSLRHQLKGAPVGVIEVIPPAVSTDLGGSGLHTFGVVVDVLADHVMARIAVGDVEIAYGTSEQASRASRPELDAMFERMNQPRR